MRLRFKAAHVVLAMLCVMYFFIHDITVVASPLVAGYVIDVTGNWYLPFLMSMGLLLLGRFSTFLMHPETPFGEGDAVPVAG